MWRGGLRLLLRNPGAVGAIVAGMVLLLLLTWWLLCQQEAGLIPPSLWREDREIACLMPATNWPNWDRFLEAVRLLVEERRGELCWASDPSLARGYRDIPALALSRRSGGGRLWFRWYKLTSDYSAEYWLAGLLRRQPRPLAILGGNTSDRALELARLLRQYHQNLAETPALLLTTATADEVEISPGAGLSDLMQVYPDRSFRFCFTNRQMAEALVDFLTHRPEWLPPDHIWDAVTWRDDPYSEDFTNRISDALLERQLGQLRKSAVPYSVGDAWLPSGRERQIIEEDLAERLAQAPNSPHVLILPTVERVARRVLIGLGQAVPLAAGNTTVVVGDSISFNVICRDRRLLWPTELLPMRALLFAHEDPARPTGVASGLVSELAVETAWATARLDGHWPVAPLASSHFYSRQSSTDDLLLWARILRAVTQAAWLTGTDAQQSARAVPNANSVLFADTDTFITRLRNFRDEHGERFFDAQGNRRLGSGEYVICLQPIRRPNRLDTWAVLEIWHSRHSGDVAEASGDFRSEEPKLPVLRGQPPPRFWRLQSRWLLCQD